MVPEKNAKVKSKKKEKERQRERFEESQELVDVRTARDVSLSIFHAVGKIVHNKRTPFVC